jgi:hypothetical protein
MSQTDPRLTLQEWLAAAYAGDAAGCPPPEAFLEAEPGSAAARRLDEHAAGCPACAAERDLALLFAAPEGAAASAADVDFVVARLAAASPVRPAAVPAGQVVPFRTPAGRPAAAAADGTTAERPVPSRRPRSASQLWKLAAALVLVLGGGLLFELSHSGAPSLPAPQVGGPVRGGEVETLAPAGEVAAIPAELRWEPRAGAQSYRVRLSAVDDTVLWEATVPASPARLPAAVAAGLHPAVAYTWTVEALDASGAPLATSEPVRFRARPRP